MLFYKIFLDCPYDTENQIGNRPLLRGYLKSGAEVLIEDGAPYILTYVDDGLFIREFFTTEFLRKANFCNPPYSTPEDFIKFNDLSRFRIVPVDKDELFDLLSLRKNKELLSVIQKALFNIENNLEISTIEELAADRAVQFDAYQQGLTTIDPYSQQYRENKALRYRR